MLFNISGGIVPLPDAVPVKAGEPSVGVFVNTTAPEPVEPFERSATRYCILPSLFLNSNLITNAKIQPFLSLFHDGKQRPNAISSLGEP